MLSVVEVSVSLSGEPILRHVSLEVQQGELVCLLGASGCGKTTLLRTIAGLEMAYDGVILLKGRDIRSVPVEKRGFGLMFQDYALFPHMTVSDNVAFGLKMQGVNAQLREVRVEQLLALVGLEGMGKRDIAHLSGGEKQRVALGRSLAPNPVLLMLDEPLGALDAHLRERLALELRQVLKANGVTAIYVTHDQQEAYAIADKVAVMNAGRIEQYDTPLALYRTPKTRFVAEFLGLNNVFEVLKWGDGIAETAIGAFHCTQRCAFICLHPHALRLSSEGVEGTLVECVFIGEQYRIKVAINEHVLGLWVSSWEDVPVVGERVWVALAPQGIIALRDLP